MNYKKTEVTFQLLLLVSLIYTVVLSYQYLYCFKKYNTLFKMKLSLLTNLLSFIILVSINPKRYILSNNHVKIYVPV